MYDAGKIIPGLIIFLIIITFPLWYSLGQSAPVLGYQVETPEIEQLEEKKCVESVSYMRASHMRLLDDWRNEVVRNSRRTYINTAGKTCEISLEETCFGCHTNKANFCDTCHSSLNVEPDCWNCHSDPKESQL